VQILLSQDRLDLARQAYEQARAWAEDSLIIQLCEAWIGLRTVRAPYRIPYETTRAVCQGGDAYQSAYYVFEEISQAPSANNASVLNGKAAAQAAQGNWPEAEAALAEAAQIVRFSRILSSRT
jgi:coatomer protein complex subunit epsilon